MLPMIIQVGIEELSREKNQVSEITFPFKSQVSDESRIYLGSFFSKFNGFA